MLKQSLQQKLFQKLSPQQIQLMKLLQVPTVALEQRIKEELESNPALEEGSEIDAREQEEYPDDYNEENKRDDFDLSQYISDDEVPSYKTSIVADEVTFLLPLSMGKSFHEILITQLGLLKLSEDDRTVAEHLIGNLDDAGYLRRELEAIVDDLAFYQNISTTEERLEALLKQVQGMEPAGVGARNLQECLMLQIKRKKRSDLNVYLASKILEKTFDEFTKKHYQKIIKKFEVTEDELKLALEEILKLNPKPGGSMNETQRVAQTVVPDFHLNIEDGELQLSLNSRNAPELKVSREYKELLKGYQANQGKASKSQKDTVMFVRQKLDSAKWFIDAIVQRQNTLLNTMQTIINLQHDYFLTGDEQNLGL